MPNVQLASGLTLRYREWGRPDGAVVVLLHGTYGDGGSWRNVGPALGEHFRVIAPDQRGRADSEWPDEYSLSLMADDVVALMDALGVLGAVVVGHSSGGLVAFLVAATYADRVRMLVLEDMPPPDAVSPRRELPLGPDPEGRWDWRAVIAISRWLNASHPDWWTLANALHIPTLVIGATRGPSNQTRLREFAHAMPEATYVGVDGGHDLHGERPSAFLQVVEPFLAPLAK